MKRLVRILIVLLVAVSCGTARQLHSAVDQVWACSQSHPEGFTLSLRTMEQPIEGIAVAYSEGGIVLASLPGRGDRKPLKGVVRHALSHDGYVGGWTDGQTGAYCLDSVRLFPEDSLQAALAFARAHAQKAVYVLSSDKEIGLK
ncbi:MAG: hypothetical protein IJV01_03275 [Bacteroidales bacterium]|nr:hypothetical protein [Bacteroidales bacterium]